MKFGRAENLTGHRFGFTQVIALSGFNANRQALWLVRCNCGVEKVRRADAVKIGKSCGCIKGNLSHGECSNGISAEWTAWSKMRNRCYNPADVKYPNYGGRGIIVCDRWNESVENFISDMGRRPSPRHSLDRYPDNNGNYEPTNCRWATPDQQSNNKRSNIIVSVNGKRMTLRQACDALQINYSRTRQRIRDGWSFERASTAPIRSAK